jgi:hypothetical protein
MRKLLLLGALFSSASLAQTSPEAPSAQGNVAVTIYNDNLALVQDTRQLDLPARRSRQEFPDVSAQIRPETVSLGGEGIEIVEQNFDFDLLSPQAMMEKAVGQTITIVRTNPGTGQETRERATVLAVNRGVVLRIGDRIEVLRDDGLPVRGDLRQGAGEPPRPADLVRDAGKPARRRPSRDLELPDPGARLEGRLCRHVRRARRQDRCPGLGDAHQQ